MPATTTVRLGDLQDRVAAAAERTGKLVHGLMVDAIAESVMRHEQRAEFVGDAVARRERFLGTGKSVSFEEMERYAQALARGEGPSKPRATTRSKAKAR